MALETVIYPQDQTDHIFQYDHLLQEDHNHNHTIAGIGINHHHHAYNWGDNIYTASSSSSPEDYFTGGADRSDLCIDGRQLVGSPVVPAATHVPTSATAVGRRRKWRRKNREELENERMNHITTERNRRKQMNDYLAVIRSLMPSSYVQRGDQASIIGGAINFVKELEQLLQTLEAQRITNINGHSTPPPPQPFDYFFTSPQYSTLRTANGCDGSATVGNNRLPAAAEIEVTMVESQANIKIMCKKQHTQLLKMVAGLGCLWLTILHLNVTPFEDMVLYTFSVRLEERCQLKTIDDIADAVNCLLC